MKERLSLQVHEGGIAASHRFGVFGLPYLELRYDIARKPDVSSGTGTTRLHP